MRRATLIRERSVSLALWTSRIAIGCLLVFLIPALAPAAVPKVIVCEEFGSTG